MKTTLQVIMRPIVIGGNKKRKPKKNKNPYLWLNFFALFMTRTNATSKDFHQTECKISHWGII